MCNGRHVHRIDDRRVPPGRLLLEFFVRVLSVVDQEINPVTKLEYPRVDLSLILGLLMVAHKCDRCPARFYPEPERCPYVRDLPDLDLRGSDSHLVVGDAMKPDVVFELFDLDREERRLEDSLEGLVQGRTRLS